MKDFEENVLLKVKWFQSLYGICYTGYLRSVSATYQCLLQQFGICVDFISLIFRLLIPSAYR